MILISLRQIYYWQGPVYRQRRVVNIERPLHIRMVGRGVQIDQFAVFSQRLKSMRISFRNEQTFTVFSPTEFQHTTLKRLVIRAADQSQYPIFRLSSSSPVLFLHAVDFENASRERRLFYASVCG